MAVLLQQIKSIVTSAIARVAFADPMACLIALKMHMLASSDPVSKCKPDADIELHSYYISVSKNAASEMPRLN